MNTQTFEPITTDNIGKFTYRGISFFLYALKELDSSSPSGIYQVAHWSVDNYDIPCVVIPGASLSGAYFPGEPIPSFVINAIDKWIDSSPDMLKGVTILEKAPVMSHLFDDILEKYGFSRGGWEDTPLRNGFEHRDGMDMFIGDFVSELRGYEDEPETDNRMCCFLADLLEQRLNAEKYPDSYIWTTD